MDKIFFTIFVSSVEFDVISWLCIMLKNVSLGHGGLIEIIGFTKANSFTGAL